jgi:hypothetical protein
MTMGVVMSPFEAWSRASTITCIRLPQDLDELDVLCCDVVSCTLTGRGIVLENCTFNTPSLQAIWRDAPIQSRGRPSTQSRKRTSSRISQRADMPAESMQVEVRFNRALMDGIWVLDPGTKTRLRVPNIDPVKARLSAYQIALALKIQRQASDKGQRITVGQAIERLRDAARELQFGRNLAQRRQALKVLGLSYEETPASEGFPPESSTRQRRDPNPRVAEDFSPESIKDGLHRPPKRDANDNEVRRLRTVIRPPRGTVQVDK